MNLNDVLIRAHITEKAMARSKSGVYSFVVAKTATKPQIKQVAEKLFKVKVDYVRVVAKTGKKRRVGKRMKPKSLPDSKIALLKISEGKIDIFPET